eukprot:6444043-Ditylum_brightwellii.AAC.1
MEEAQFAKCTQIEPDREREIMDLNEGFLHIGLLDGLRGRGNEEKKMEEEDHPLSEKVSNLEKSVTSFSDTLAAMKGQKDLENMVVDIGRTIFKGERDV